MNETRRQRLIKAAQRRHEEAVAAAKVKLEKELESIEVVYQMEQESGHAGRPRSGPRLARLTQCVKDAIPHLPAARFTAADVESFLSSRSDLNGSVNRKSIANVMQKLADDEFVKVIEPGKGRRATLFGRVDDEIPQEFT